MDDYETVDQVDGDIEEDETLDEYTQTLVMHGACVGTYMAGGVVRRWDDGE